MNILEAARETRPALLSVSRCPSILYVDDHELLLEEVRSLLQAKGWVCQCAKGGADALRLLTSGVDPADILMTDHSMPGMNGLELVRNLGARKFPGKILVYSTLLLSIERAAYEELNVDAIVSKISGPDVLINAIQELQRRG